MNTLIVTPYP